MWKKSFADSSQSSWTTEAIFKGENKIFKDILLNLVSLKKTFDSGGLQIRILTFVPLLKTSQCIDIITISNESLIDSKYFLS